MIKEQEYKEAKKIVYQYEQNAKQDPANCYEFNINDSILVKLYDEGFKHWVKAYAGLSEEYIPSIEQLKAKADKDGYIQFQAWDFFRIFGETASMGQPPIFATNVRFYRSEIKTIKA